jgi:hypothetical protein
LPQDKECARNVTAGKFCKQITSFGCYKIRCRPFACPSVRGDVTIIIVSASEEMPHSPSM